MAEFVNTIDALGDDAVVDSIITRTITEFKDDKITSVGNNAFAGCVNLEEVSLPSCTDLWGGAFSGCTALQKLNVPKAIALNSGALSGCSALREFDFSEVTTLNSDACQGAFADGVVPCFPKVKTAGPRVFTSPRVRIIDLPVCSSLWGITFYNCPKLIALILRNSDEVCTTEHADPFTGNWVGNVGPISKGEGYIYVPSALIEEYKVATNWANFADQFRALEDYTVDGTVTGALDETKI